ncbi:MAG: DEAD/DEAH box helicase, partial [Candidatus Omnitrophica bacterium]|nr:DEAD/DEAH box helicase [Candidatus Omnitrophota bacterium]
MLYDKFQQEAINAINNGLSVLVSAPTGAGKTAIAEHVIQNCLDKGVGCIYTAPIKALSNQKFRDFQQQYHDNIGILTGDVCLNSNAPVLIMTTEIFRNKILDEPESLKPYHWIIFDEIHYIDNYERGTVWEEALMFLPKHMNFLGLSATIPNCKELANWLETIHQRPVAVIIENKRPVPLHFFFQYNNQIVDKINLLRRTHLVKPNRLHTLIEYIRNKQGLPCIYFVFGRRRTEELACELSTYNFLNKEEQESIEKMFFELCQKFELTYEKSTQLLYPLIKRGIAYHHAGMLPTLKEVVERLFTSRLVKVIFTTETFALGINMPSRSVIFDDLRKYYGRYLRPLKTRDFYQMAGRAGRRGIDDEGFVYCRVHLGKIRLEEIKEIIYNPPEKVNSQFNTSYATILNLYEKYQEEISRVYPLSFHYFQTKRKDQEEALRLMHTKLKLLKEDGFIEKGKLTPKGLFAKAVHGYELVLSELYTQNIFEYLDEFGLAVVAAACVFEPRKNQALLHISKNTRKIKMLCEEIYEKIKEKEAKLRIYPFSKAPYFHLSLAMEYWLRGTDFSKILVHTDTDEGEVVRYFRMAVQILRQLSDNPVCSPILKE